MSGAQEYLFCFSFSYLCPLGALYCPNGLFCVDSFSGIGPLPVVNEKCLSSVSQYCVKCYWLHIYL